MFRKVIIDISGNVLGSFATPIDVRQLPQGHNNTACLGPAPPADSMPAPRSRRFPQEKLQEMGQPGLQPHPPRRPQAG